MVMLELPSFDSPAPRAVEQLEELTRTLNQYGIPVIKSCPGHITQFVFGFEHKGRLERENWSYPWIDLRESERFPELVKAVDAFSERNFWPWTFYKITPVVGVPVYRLYQPAGTLTEQQQALGPLNAAIRAHFEKL